MNPSPLWQTLPIAPCELGESPFWHPHEQRLYWVDIAGRKVLRADADGARLQTWELPDEPGCIAPAASGGLVLALRHGVFRARSWGAPLQLLARLDYDPAQMRANDGKCDAQGRFWIGTIDETRALRNAALYVLDGRGGSVRVQRRIEHATTANGLAWSPDGRTLYWADTPSHQVRAWDFEPTQGELRAERSWHRFAPKPPDWRADGPAPQPAYGGRPDGATVDAWGNYYVALFEGQRLCQLAPDGRLLAELATPVRCPTMPCLGGPDLRTLFLTSARHHRSAAELARFPDSGALFSMRVDVPGLPVNFFAD